MRLQRSKILVLVGTLLISVTMMLRSKNLPWVSATAQSETTCQAHRYSYETQAALSARGRDGDAQAQQSLDLLVWEQPLRESAPYHVTGVQLGADKTAVFYVVHDSSGGIQSIYYARSMPDVSLPLIFPAIARLPYFVPEYFQSSTIEDVEGREFGFVASGLLEAHEDGWLWRADKLSEMPRMGAEVRLHTSEKHIIGYHQRTRWDRLEGTLVLEYGVSSQTIPSSEIYRYTYRSEENLGDCTLPKLEALAEDARLQLLSYQQLDKTIADLAQREFYQRSFDLEARLTGYLQDARQRGRDSALDEQSARIFAQLIEYFRLYPNQQERILKDLRQSLADAAVDSATIGAYIDLVASFDSASARQLLLETIEMNDVRIDAKLKAQILVHFNFLERADEADFKTLLRVSSDGSESMPVRSSALFAAASVASRERELQQDMNLTLQVGWKNAKTFAERSIIIGSYGNLNSPESRSFLQELSQGKDKAIALEALQSLGRQRAEETPELLYTYLAREDLDLDLRRSALDGLCKRFVQAESEPAYRRWLESRYQTFASPHREQLSQHLWACVLARGTTPRAELNQQLLSQIKENRKSYAWELLPSDMLQKE